MEDAGGVGGASSRKSRAGRGGCLSPEFVVSSSSSDSSSFCVLASASVPSRPSHEVPAGIVPCCVVCAGAVRSTVLRRPYVLCIEECRFSRSCARVAVGFRAEGRAAVEEV